VSAFTYADETQFAIVIPSYNNAKWCEKNLASVCTQTNPNWHIYYINDASSDKTKKLVKHFIKQHNISKKCTLINNKTRKGALANLYNTINSINPNHVVVLLDGDDWFNNPAVLETLATVYANPNTWLTYGSFVSEPAGYPSPGRPIPPVISETLSFRSHRWVSSHLRTFYAKLFQNIKRSDLLFKGSFYPMAWDLAIMFPMLEMASKGHFQFVDKILYTYNISNPLNDFKVNRKLLHQLDKEIRKKPPYPALSHLFDAPAASGHDTKTNVKNEQPPAKNQAEEDDFDPALFDSESYEHVLKP
jgi:glycosyltransferase involved in cell wall biosynthesis